MLDGNFLMTIKFHIYEHQDVASFAVAISTIKKSTSSTLGLYKNLAKTYMFLPHTASTTFCDETVLDCV